MSKRRKKKPEKFGEFCSGFPRCAKCEWFYECEDCEDPFCLCHGGTLGTKKIDNILCEECFEKVRAWLDITKEELENE